MAANGKLLEMHRLAYRGDRQRAFKQRLHVYQYLPCPSEGHPRLAASALISSQACGLPAVATSVLGAVGLKRLRSNQTAPRELKSCSKISETVTTASSASRANPSRGLRSTGNRTDARGVLSYLFGGASTERGTGVLNENFAPGSELWPLMEWVPGYAPIVGDSGLRQRSCTCGLRARTRGSAGSSRSAGHGRSAAPAGTARPTRVKGGCRPSGPTGCKGRGRPAGAARRTGTAGSAGSIRAAGRRRARRSARPSRPEGRQGGQRHSRRVREQDPASRLWIRRLPRWLYRR